MADILEHPAFKWNHLKADKMLGIQRFGASDNPKTAHTFGSDALDRMRENPAHGWRMADIQAICDRHEVMCKPPKGGGSHYKVFHGKVPEILTIPFKRPIKPVYIRRFVAFIDAVKAKK